MYYQSFCFRLFFPVILFAANSSFLLLLMKFKSFPTKYVGGMKRAQKTSTWQREAVEEAKAKPSIQDALEGRKRNFHAMQAENVLNKISIMLRYI